MSLRISDGMVSHQMVRDIQDAQGRLARSQERVSTGRELRRPSDDPAAAARALGLRSSLEALQQHRRSVNDASAWSDATDTALGDIGDVASRARELLVQAGNGTLDGPGREAVATELDSLADRAKEAAGATLGGRYLLSGTATTTRPYAPGSDAYQGNAGAVTREIGPGVSVQVNQTAATVLGSGSAASDGKLLDALRSAAAHLRSGTPADFDALRTTDLRGVEAATDTISLARAQNGALGERLAAAGPRLDALEGSLTTLLSQTQDADLSSALVDLSQQQSAYQSALRAGATLVGPTLLDFLR